MNIRVRLGLPPIEVNLSKRREHRLWETTLDTWTPEFQEQSNLATSRITQLVAAINAFMDKEQDFDSEIEQRGTDLVQTLRDKEPYRADRLLELGLGRLVRKENLAQRALEEVLRTRFKVASHRPSMTPKPSTTDSRSSLRLTPSVAPATKAVQEQSRPRKPAFLPSPTQTCTATSASPIGIASSECSSSPTLTRKRSACDPSAEPISPKRRHVEYYQSHDSAQDCGYDDVSVSEADEEPGDDPSSKAAGNANNIPDNHLETTETNHTASDELCNTTNGRMLHVDKDILPGDYIFEDPSFGPGWYVLRCIPDEALPDKDHPFNQQGHPYGDKAALRHFNSMYSKCHKWAGWLSEREIMEKYAYSVGGRGLDQPAVDYYNKQRLKDSHDNVGECAGKPSDAEAVGSTARAKGLRGIWASVVRGDHGMLTKLVFSGENELLTGVRITTV